MFKREHLTHHARDYFTSLGTKVRMASPAAVVLVTLSLVFAPLPGAAFTLGFLGAYIGYEVCHRRLHTHPPRGPWGRLLRRHHFFHHFGDARTNHGVTSPLWDRLFGTLALPETVCVPPARAPEWLVDRSTGALRDPSFSQDYRLATPRRRGSRARSERGESAPAA